MELLGRQIYGKAQLPFFMSSFEQATEKPFGYLLIDLHPLTQSKHRLRTGIIPNERQFIFLPK